MAPSCALDDIPRLLVPGRSTAAVFGALRAHLSWQVPMRRPNRTVPFFCMLSGPIDTKLHFTN
jgi:hypothetical protein